MGDARGGGGMGVQGSGGGVGGRGVGVSRERGGGGWTGEKMVLRGMMSLRSKSRWLSRRTVGILYIWF